MKMRLFSLFAAFALAVSAVAAQNEMLTNELVVEMTRVGLDKEIIVRKINETPGRYDVSVNALIDLRRAGVDSEIIALLLEKSRGKTETRQYSENVSLDPVSSVPEGRRTIAIEKSSVHPSRQALEKELLKRPEWNGLNLNIVRYKESADLYIEIGRVPLSWISHRYAFRVYDRRTGTVIVAGETTSWGSLAQNLAREIARKLAAKKEF